MYQNRFFLKRFRKFFLIMFFPIVIVCIVFLSFLISETVTTLKNQQNNTLSEIDDNLDLVVNDTVYQQILITNDQGTMLSLKKLLSKDHPYDYNDSVFNNQLGTVLRGVTYSRYYIDSIYLYLDGYNKFFSSVGGISSLDTSYDKDWINSYDEDYTQDEWIVKRKINEYSYEPPLDVLTIYRRTSSLNGVIVINIDEKKLISMLNTVNTNQNEHLYILDDKYIPLVSDTNTPKSNEYIQTGKLKDYIYSNKINVSEMKNRWINISGKNYLINIKPIKKLNINVVSLISSDNILYQMKYTLTIIILFCVVMVMVIVLLAYITTRRIFNQIDYMIQVFGDAEKGKITKINRKNLDDEYDIIMNNVIHKYLQTAAINEQLKERQYELEVAELTALQLQINPHFLINTLQTMDFEAIKIMHGPSSINNIIHDLSDMLKCTLGNPKETMSLDDEITYLKQYVNIQKYRFGEKFIVYYEFSSNIRECRILRLILQPILENSILHGVRPLNELGYIKIKAFESGDYIHFNVIDNGVGIEKEKLKELSAQINDPECKKVGLTNVNKRLILEYGKTSGLHIRSKKGVGTSVSFKIPYSISTVIVKNDTDLAKKNKK